METKSLSELINNFNISIEQKKINDAIRFWQEIINYYHKENNFSKCIEYTEFIIPYLNDPSMQLLRADALQSLSKYNNLSENYDVMEERLQEALKIYEENKLDLKAAEIKTDLGIVYRNKGLFEIALNLLNDAVDVFSTGKDRLDLEADNRLWFSYINAIEACGIIYGQLKQYDEAINFFTDALRLKEKILGDSGKISALLNLGVIYSNIDLEKAEQYYLQALNESTNETPIHHRIVLLNNLGGCLEDQKHYDKALLYYEKALKLITDSGLIRYKSQVIKHIASVHYLQGEFDKALETIEPGLELSEKNETKYEMKDCYQLISDIYIAKNDYQTAMNYRLKYDELKDELYHQDLKTQLTSLQKNYEKSTLSIATLKQEKSLISEELKKAIDTGFVGESDSIKEVRRLAIEAAAYKDTRVLITGESGVGKEIVAKLIHYSDALKTGKFIDVNCCAIPDSMAESEFFGFVKGAFTGAIYSKSGFFEEANNGSLFLDEIGDMPLVLQSKLLRVLETKQIKRLGSTKSSSVSFRLISATNKNLSRLIEDNRFRGDLLYRINTIEINIPPLRERKEDIEPLLVYFLELFASKMNKPNPNYSKELITYLKRYSFPGNVRELKNMIERALIFMKGNQITIEDFSSQMQTNITGITVEPAYTCHNIKDLESQVLLNALEDCNGNQTRAAEKMGISYATFKRRYKAIRENYPKK